jgi:drug/metabolite transporter (DMT)-like permease
MGPSLALLSAICFGVADYLGGLGGRRSDARLVPVAIQAAALIATGAAVLVCPGAGPTAHTLLWGAVGGAGSGLGNAAIYRGLAYGRMSVVAPLSAVTAAVVPAIAGIASGEQLSTIAWIGLGLALPAILLTSWTGGAVRVGTRDAGYGLAAGAGFGLLFIALKHAGTDHGAWPLVVSQLTSLVIVTAIAAPRDLHAPRRVWRLVVRWGTPAGALIAAANLLFLSATGRGQLTVTAVLASLYPAVTVLLATIHLGEELRSLQVAGLISAAAAVAAIVSG